MEGSTHCTHRCTYLKNFTELFYRHIKRTFLIYLTLQAVSSLTFYGSTKILELVTHLFT